MRCVWFLVFLLCGCQILQAEPVPEASAATWQAPPDLVKRLESHVVMLAGTIGQRHIDHPEGYKLAENYLADQLQGFGYTVQRQSYAVGEHTSVNLWAEKKGAQQGVVVLGAHYDSLDSGTPGADDNASGCAGVLELARMLRHHDSGPTLRFVFFANEEPPHFHDDAMGSLVYARKCQADGDEILGMLSLECIGYFSDQPQSQKLPARLASSYPTRGNYIAFVSDLGSQALMQACLSRFQAAGTLAAEGIAAPAAVDGISWSDHWSFWKCGYPAVMVTDTALYRNPHYHLSTDTPDTLDYQRMAGVVEGVRQIVVGWEGSGR